MKNVFFTILLMFCCWQANSQDYVQLSNECFEKGDYECAKKNYTLFQTLDGKDMSAQIRKADECLKTMNIANEYFREKEYEKARDRYKIVLNLNPNDPNAQKQYDECVRISQPADMPIQSDPRREKNTQSHPAEPEMIFVSGGTFRMGCLEEQEVKCPSNALPVHQVTVSSFYIGSYEVTQGQWVAVMGTNPSKSKNGPNYPVEKVSWKDVQKFIQKLNQLTGKNYRLPTEAEWEYAARGGRQGQGNRFSGSNIASDVAWTADNSGKTTHPVCQKRPNELGIYDMSGNVWEWCQDRWGAYSEIPQTDPQGPASALSVVRRGGSWANAPATVSHRWYDSQNQHKGGHTGFRLALSL